MNDRILKINKIDKTYFKYRKISVRSRIAFREIKLNECHEKKKIYIVIKSYEYQMTLIYY